MAKEGNDHCTLGNVNKSRIDNLEQDIKSLVISVNIIKDKLLKRPSWFILGLITFMSNVIICLFAYIIGNME